jgi:succinate dehydrogenase hydrophobic anchor subunit
MQKSLSTFMGIAVTAVVIVTLLFVLGVNTMKTETADYNTTVTNSSTKLPALPTGP